MAISVLATREQRFPKAATDPSQERRQTASRGLSGTREQPHRVTLLPPCRRTEMSALRGERQDRHRMSVHTGNASGKRFRFQSILQRHESEAAYSRGPEG